MLAWLTPDQDDLSAPVEQRAITLSNELWPFVSGALIPLADSRNWEQFGSATPDQMAQYFQDVLYNISPIEMGGQMNWIEQTTYTVDNVTGHVGAYILDIVHGDLPVEASEATGLLLDVQVTFSAPSSFWVVSPPLDARQVYAVNDSPYQFSGYIWAPIMSGTCRVWTRNLSPVTVDMYTGLIAWV
jgi:hypothetical protein